MPSMPSTPPEPEPGQPDPAAPDPAAPDPAAPDPAAPDPTAADPVGEIVARLAGAGEVDRRQQGRALGSLARALTVSARGAGRASVLGGRWLTDLLVDVAPRIPLRDLATLREQHGGLAGEELADALTAAAARATAAVGAAGGALAAVEFAAPPMLLTTPVQIAAETLLVAAVEIKLMAELHEVYGAAVAGTPGQRATAYLMAWTNRRGIDPLDPSALRFTVGTAARRAIRRRLVRRAGRNLSTLGPLMTGAVAGGVVNHRETRRLGEQVRADLRRTATLA
jgi:hypothetical protein